MRATLIGIRSHLTLCVGINATFFGQELHNGVHRRIVCSEEVRRAVFTPKDEFSGLQIFQMM